MPSSTLSLRCSRCGYCKMEGLATIAGREAVRVALRVGLRADPIASMANPPRSSTYPVRQGVRRLIDLYPDLELLAACADYESLARAIEEHEPDVVITDSRMPPTETDEGIPPGNNNVAIAASLVLSERAVDVVLMDGHQAPGHQRHRGNEAARQRGADPGCRPDTRVILLSTYRVEDLPKETGDCGASC